MNQYIVPANSKKSAQILGLFTYTDLIILGIGGTFTLAMLLILDNPNFIMLILALSPLLFSGFLVFPVPNYHNILQLIINIYTFYTGRRKYYWKGWCVSEYVKDDNRKF